MIKYTMEHLFSYNVTIGPPEIVGPVPEGLRVNFYITGGEVSGPKLKGKVLPVGGDWLLMRNDGVAVFDVRMTLQTDDGAIIYAAYNGISDLGENGYQDFLAGQPPAPGTPIRVFPKFQTAHDDYRWLTRLACVGVGEAHVAFDGKSQVIYDIYALN